MLTFSLPKLSILRLLYKKAQHNLLGHRVIGVKDNEREFISTRFVVFWRLHFSPTLLIYSVSIE